MAVTPNFFIIGAPKCGTTSLWHELRKHPNVFMPDEKEPQFFEHGYSAEEWKQYCSLFEEGYDKKAIGEASPGYSNTFLRPKLPERLASAVPQARLIYIVRHPLRRMESSWKQNVFRGRLPPDTFADAVRKYTPILEGSRYYQNLQTFRSHFSDKQIQVVFLEDLSRHPDRVLNRCYDFLGVASVAESIEDSPAKNTSEHRYVTPKSYYTLQGAGTLKVLKKIVPTPLRRALSSIFLAQMKEPVPEPEWDPRTRKWAADRVREDARRLLAYAGKPLDFWDLTARRDCASPSNETPSATESLPPVA